MRTKGNLNLSSTNRILAGTVGGLGEYFGLSRSTINISRAVILLMTFMTWGWIKLLIVYAIATLIMKKGSQIWAKR